MNEFSPEESGLRPHPLAAALAERLRGSAARILEIGTGSGRNRRALLGAGFAVDSFEEVPRAPGAYDAALSTHAFLHGSAEQMGANADAVSKALKSGTPFYCTFGSVRDARFGHGTRLGPSTFAPADGDERGVPHTYFTEDELRSLITRRFEIESLEEVSVDEIVGRWAHATAPRGSVHFFLVARKKPSVPRN